MFELYLDNVKKAHPKNFKLYNQLIAHNTTARYVDFVSGLYRIANITSQDMLVLRLSKL